MSHDALITKLVLISILYITNTVSECVVVVFESHATHLNFLNDKNTDSKYNRCTLYIKFVTPTAVFI